VIAESLISGLARNVVALDAAAWGRTDLAPLCLPRPRGRRSSVLVPGPRVTAGQVVLYSFVEGGGNTINDRSGVGTPADLVIGDTGAVTWLPGALSVDASCVIATPAAATKLITAVKASNEITIEAWVKPANLTQNGPARVVTLSSGLLSRNFTMGQGIYGSASDALEVRLRTTTTDANGTPALATPAGSLATQLTHVVYTRNAAGQTKVYINGTETAAGSAFGHPVVVSPRGVVRPRPWRDASSSAFAGPCAPR